MFKLVNVCKKFVSDKRKLANISFPLRSNSSRSLESYNVFIYLLPVFWVCDSVGSDGSGFLKKNKKHCGWRSHLISQRDMNLELRSDHVLVHLLQSPRYRATSCVPHSEEMVWRLQPGVSDTVSLLGWRSERRKMKEQVQQNNISGDLWSKKRPANHLRPRTTKQV